MYNAGWSFMADDTTVTINGNKRLPWMVPWEMCRSPLWKSCHMTADYKLSQLKGDSMHGKINETHTSCFDSNYNVKS